jgi:hypothetical protein
LEETKITEVQFTDSSGGGGGTAFLHGLDFSKSTMITEVPNNTLHININLDNAIRCVSQNTHWCDQLFGTAECVYDRKNIEKIGPVFRIAKMYSPFYVTIVHELIHLKHFLETLLQKGDIFYGEAVNIETYHQIIANQKMHLLPELNERDSFIKRSIPWDNFEERRTVVGPDIDGISELSFRIAEGLPIRYIYQGPENCFYENPTVFREIVKQALSSSFSEADIVNIINNSMPKGYLSEEGIDFEKFSTYHPLTVQLVLFNNDRIIKEHRVTGKRRAGAIEFLETQRRA